MSSGGESDQARAVGTNAHRHGLAGSEIEDLVDILALQADVIEPSESDDRTLADAEDQPVLGTLIAALQVARADYLITGDKALLALGERSPIVTPAAFWAARGGIGGSGGRPGSRVASRIPDLKIDLPPCVPAACPIRRAGLKTPGVW